MYTVLLKGAPISFILLLLLVYVLGACLYCISFFRDKKYFHARLYPLKKRSIRLESLESVAEESVYYFIPKMSSIDKHLQFLRLIVNLAPLLGLLGTVLGLVKSTSGLVMNDQGELLLGISQSLITTAMGLIVSIPALLVHFFGKSQQDKVIVIAKLYLLDSIES